jgi:hypothetical protein
MGELLRYLHIRVTDGHEALGRLCVRDWVLHDDRDSDRLGLHAKDVQYVLNVVLRLWTMKRCVPETQMADIVADTVVDHLRAGAFASGSGVLECLGHLTLGMSVGDWFMCESQAALLQQLQLVDAESSMTAAIAAVDKRVRNCVTELINGALSKSSAASSRLVVDSVLICVCVVCLVT